MTTEPMRRTLSATLAMTSLVLAACGAGGPAQPRANTNPQPSPLVKWPTASGEKEVDNPIWVSGEYDGQMMRHFGVGDLGTSDQDEGQEPLFRVAPGGVVKNVILGDPAADGIHCDGPCTLKNVWWERVGEDAATFRGKSTSAVMLIEGGGASGAMDKVFQNNGQGTMIIKDFYVEWFGKLYRSCGNCSAQTRRNVIVENIIAVGHKKTEGLIGINVNYGDTVEFRGKNVVYDPANRGIAPCLQYIGNNSGSEPKKIGGGAESDTCRNLDHVQILTSFED